MIFSRRYLFVILGLLALSVTAFLFLSRAPTAQLDPYWEKETADSTLVISHESWQELLDEYLITGHSSGVNRVDYEGLQEEGLETLQSYVEAMEEIDPRDYNRAEQFAFWVNVYNAVTVKLVTENYPVDSITELGKSTLTFGPWEDVLVNIAGKPLTLNDIEHRILRPLWKDYRIHFVANCGSIGCPNLSAQAFTALNQEQLLEQASNDYLQHSRGLYFDKGKLTLSSIFDWYKEDFGASQAERLHALSQYLPDPVALKVDNYSGTIDYRYDWQLNKD
jgi:hypothetical protein